jgi:putative MATE family efflux protein
MSNTISNELGTKPIGKLILNQSVPAAIGILVMSLNMLIDTIFVGNWIGPNAIAAISVVLPAVFLIASVGMAIGIGGASIISRAFGEDNDKKAQQVFGNQIALALILSITLLGVGIIFKDHVLFLFGAKGVIIEPARDYFTIALYGIPTLCLFMTGNPVIRAEGKANFSMIALMIPAIANILLDYLFIVVLDMGITGAGLATSISYGISFVFVFWFFLSKHSEIQLQLQYLKLKWKIVKEISALGFVTLARQGVISVLSIILNHALYNYGGATSITIYGIISRLLMFALFPISGIAQGFMPIVGYNFGARKLDRVKEAIVKSISYGTILAILVFTVLMIFPSQIVRLFTDDAAVLEQTPSALRTVFLITPLIAFQLIGSGYFQAIGKARLALLLTLTKQGFFLIPLILILPNYFGLLGVWVAFPIADLFSTLVTTFFLRIEMKRNLN